MGRLGCGFVTSSGFKYLGLVEFVVQPKLLRIKDVLMK